MANKKLIMIILAIVVTVSLVGYYYTDAYSTTTSPTATQSIHQGSSNVVYTTHNQSIYNLLKKMGFNVRLLTSTIPTTSKPTQTPTTPVSSVQGLTADEQTMFNLVNKERVANGVKPLELDMRLVKTARLKSQDMVNIGYFDHQSPTYGSTFDMIKQCGISFSYAGENLAGAPDVNTAHVNLMKSPGHRENILRPEFTKVGVGVAEGSKYGKIFTQQFIKE